MFEQPTLFATEPYARRAPLAPPPPRALIVRRMWDFKDKHFATRNPPPLTTGRMVAGLARDNPNLACSASAVYRARRDWPQYFPRDPSDPDNLEKDVWPLLPEHTRPWSDAPDQPVDAEPVTLVQADLPGVDGLNYTLPGWEVIMLPAKDAKTGEERVVEIAKDPNGTVTILVRHVPSAIAAGVAASGLLDWFSDGRADNIVRWCHVYLTSLFTKL